MTEADVADETSDDAAEDEANIPAETAGDEVEASGEDVEGEEPAEVDGETDTKE